MDDSSSEQPAATNCELDSEVNIVSAAASFGHQRSMIMIMIHDDEITNVIKTVVMDDDVKSW